jgi:hypothetical protein
MNEEEGDISEEGKEGMVCVFCKFTEGVTGALNPGDRRVFFTFSGPTKRIPCTRLIAVTQ